MKPAMIQVAAALATLALGPAVLVLGGAPALEAWLPPFLLGLGLVVGALGTLVLGHLLEESWLAPLRPALEAMARTAPLVALLALPMLLAPGMLYPWAADPGLLEGPRAVWFDPAVFRLRTAVLLAALVAAAAMLTRPGVSGLWAAIALPLLLPAALLLPQDLLLSRDLDWFGSLQGTALVVEQGAVALAAAVLVTLLRGGQDAHAELRGADRVLLLLAMLTLWLWFVQFIVVWMADLPPEAGWYLRRGGGGWLWLKLVMVAGVTAAIVIAIPPRTGPRRLGLVAALLLAQHPAHLWWLARPDAAGNQPSAWLDAVVAAALLAILAAGWWGAFSRPARHPRPAPPTAARATASAR